jgi:hypothetical protein
MGKRGRAEDKGKKENEDLEEIKGCHAKAPVAKLPLFAGLKTASRAVACAPLSPHPWSPRASLVFSAPSLPKPTWAPLPGGALSLVALDTSGGVRTHGGCRF